MPIIQPHLAIAIGIYEKFEGLHFLRPRRRVQPLIGRLELQQ